MTPLINAKRLLLGMKQIITFTNVYFGCCGDFMLFKVNIGDMYFKLTTYELGFGWGDRGRNLLYSISLKICRRCVIPYDGSCDVKFTPKAYVRGSGCMAIKGADLRYFVRRQVSVGASDDLELFFE